MKFCDRCYEEYEDDEIVQFDKESPKWICLPCKWEFDNCLKIFLIEFFNSQPERSKREDSLIREMMKDSAVDFSKVPNDPPYPLVWDKDLNFIGHKVIEEMRCSEHDGNIVRDK